MKNKYKYILLASLLPILALADGVTGSTPLSGTKALLQSIGDIINTLIKLTFGLAIVYFFWGMGQFILSSDDKKTRDEGKERMKWGIIALFVMASIFGILRFISSATGIGVQFTGGADNLGGGNDCDPALYGANGCR